MIEAFNATGVSVPFGLQDVGPFVYNKARDGFHYNGITHEYVKAAARYPIDLDVYKRIFDQTGIMFKPELSMWNIYDGGFIRHHHDTNYGDIASLSFGDTTWMDIRSCATGKQRAYRLRAGSLFIMSARANESHTHAVRPAPGVRFSLIFRNDGIATRHCGRDFCSVGM